MARRKIKRLKPRRSGMACPECGATRFIEDTVRGELVCGVCGLVLKEDIIDTGQEWRAFDSEQMARRARGGAPLTFSVDYEEPIVIRRNGKIEIIKIGRFVDDIIKNSKKVVKDKILEIAKVKDKVEVLSFDENYKVCFKKISEVSRHPVTKIFEIELETGKKIKVTGSHSIFTVKSNKVVPKMVNDLKVGDYVVAPLKIPLASKEDMIEEFSETSLKDFYVRNLLQFGFLTSKKIAETFPLFPVGIESITKITHSFPHYINSFEKIATLGMNIDFGEIKAIKNLIPAPLNYKKEWKNKKRITRKFAEKIALKYRDLQLLKLCHSDFIFLRVKKIREVRPTSKYAYDLTVPSTESFGGKVFFHNTKHDKGLTTEIGKGLGELYKVPRKKRAQYYRLTKWHKRLIRSKDRNLSFALSELQRIVSFLNLSKPVHEKIAKYYEQAVNKGLVRGRSIESVVAALTYAVSREFGSPRTLDEISEASGVDKREIGRTYRYIARELKIRILPADPINYVPRFCSMLGLSDKVQAKAIQILKKAKKFDITSGKGPTGVAAAAIYIASVLVGERRTQREVADTINVTEVTIRNRQKELVEKLGIEEEIEKRARE